MTHSLHHLIRPTLFAVLVASACSAMAAQRVELATSNGNLPSFGAATIHSLSGLSADDLKPISTAVNNGQNVTRFQQYYRGVPILGEAIVVKGTGNAATSAASSLSGAVLRNLSQDLPSVRPTLSAKTVLDQAKTLSRTQQSSKEQVNLYIKQAANGAAHLVYVVSFVNDGARNPSQPVFMIDADSGAVLDQWDGQDSLDATGPGSSKTALAALAALAKTPGWNLQKAREFLNYSNDIYLSANSNARQGACGAEKAALDLGYKVAEVTAAFRHVGKCRSSAVIDLSGTTLAQLSAPDENIHYVSGEVHRLDQSAQKSLVTTNSATNLATAPASLTTLASTKVAYGSSSRINATDLSRMGSHANADFAKNRFASVIGSGTQKPINVDVNDVMLGGTGVNPNATQGWYADKRFVGTGQISDIPNYNAWTHVSGYNIQVVPNLQNVTINLASVLLFSSATTQATNWSLSATAGVKIGGKIGLPLVTEGSVEVNFSLTGTGGGSTSVTKTTNFYRPAIDVPVGYEAVFELVERWRPVSAVWAVPLEISGRVGSDYGPGKWNGSYFWSVNAAAYFSEYGNRTGAESYKVNLNEKYQIEMMVRGYIRPRTL